MKKSVCIISLVTAISMLSIPFSNATAGEDDYQPSLRFKPIETEEAQIIRNGSVYVNSSLLNDQNNAFDAEVYIIDEQKQVGHIIAKWKCDSEYIKLANLKDPITLCGHSPYSNFTTSNSIATTEHPELNRHYLSYSLGLYTDPFDLTGETSYDYPIAGFSAVLNNEIPAGKYAIEFMSGESGAQCEVLYKYRDSNDYKEFMPVGEYAKPININVSDRMLGDINNDGIITGSDATMVLQEYTYLSSGGQNSYFTTEQQIAADINDDGIITGTDATWLLQYYTSLSSGCEDSIYDYFL